jgi:heme/copper-type cytochrome/quinol oxidase subunit 2
MLQIASHGTHLIVLLVFEAVALLLLRLSPFEHHRPTIEPVMLRVVWATICLFGISSLAAFAVQAWKHLESQEPGPGGWCVALVAVVALAGGSVFSVPHAPESHDTAAPTSAQHPSVASLFLPPPVRGEGSGKPEPLTILVWPETATELCIGVFVAVQKNVTYQWELDGDGYRQDFAVPDDGYVGIRIPRSRLGRGLHHLVIHRIATGLREPDRYMFRTIDAR